MSVERQYNPEDPTAIDTQFAEEMRSIHKGRVNFHYVVERADLGLVYNTLHSNIGGAIAARQELQEQNPGDYHIRELHRGERYILHNGNLNLNLTHAVNDGKF